MRRIATLAAFLACVALAGSARADVIFSLQWRDTGTQSLSILPGDTAAGGQRTLDLFLSIDVQSIGFGVTVALPDGSGVSFLGADLWDGVAVPGANWFFYGPAVLDVDEPALQLEPYQEAYDFASFLAPPNAPPWLPPGDYWVGSVLLDTSSLAGGANIETFFVPALDGLGIDDGAGNLVYSDDATFLNATLGTAQLFVVPEPATGALVAARVACLALRARRRGTRAA